MVEGSDALGFEDKLWAAANKLRGSMDSSRYKHVVLPLVFLKYISEQFEDKDSTLLEKGEIPKPSHKRIGGGNLWIPDVARWSYILSKAKEELKELKADLKKSKDEGSTSSKVNERKEIKLFIHEAMGKIEQDNDELMGILPKNFGVLEISSQILCEVVVMMGDLPSFGNENARSKDVIGRVYEYYIGKFAGEEKKNGGEFYTPRSVVRLIVEILQPYQGTIYDGCCGSGGMFVQSLKFMNAHSNTTKANIIGQEYNPETWRLTKMNFAARGIEANLGDGAGDTLRNDNYKDKKINADFTMVNPPFNIKDWGSESLQDDSRWIYGVPPKGNANYAWIQHYLHHLAPQGMAGIVMSNGSLSTTKKEEKTIREGIIKDDKLDCVIMLPDKLFTNTGISACIWILTNDKTDKKFRNRSGETLFIDCRGMGDMVNRTLRELSKKDVAKIAGAYQNWRSKDNFDQYEDERGFCKAVTTENEIKEHKYIIVPGRYVGAPPLPDDGESFEDKMKRLTKELGEHFAESRRLEKEITKNLSDLGFSL